MELTFKAIDEGLAGPEWAALFAAKWPAYRRWYLGDGIDARPGYTECIKALRAHMPEIVPMYERLCELAGGGDLEARFLSLYRPPAFVQGCSQAAWTQGEPVLMRNYDFSPALAEGTILKSGWNGGRVIASVDCTWGVLDGINRGRSRAQPDLRRAQRGRRRLRDLDRAALHPRILRHRGRGRRGARPRAGPHGLQRDRARQVGRLSDDLHLARPRGDRAPPGDRHQPPEADRVAPPRARHRDTRARALPVLPPDRPRA